MFDIKNPKILTNFEVLGTICLSFVFIPVKAEILTATVENDTKIYTSEFYDSTSNLQYNWSTSGNIIVDKK